MSSVDLLQNYIRDTNEILTNVNQIKFCTGKNSLTNQMNWVKMNKLERIFRTFAPIFISSIDTPQEACLKASLVSLGISTATLKNNLSISTDPSNEKSVFTHLDILKKRTSAIKEAQIRPTSSVGLALKNILISLYQLSIEFFSLRSNSNNENYINQLEDALSVSLTATAEIAAENMKNQNNIDAKKDQQIISLEKRDKMHRKVNGDLLKENADLRNEIARLQNNLGKKSNFDVSNASDANALAEKAEDLQQNN